MVRIVAADHLNLVQTRLIRQRARAASQRSQAKPSRPATSRSPRHAMSLTLAHRRSSIRTTRRTPVVFTPISVVLNRLMRSDEYLATLTHEPWSVHIALGAERRGRRAAIESCHLVRPTGERRRAPWHRPHRPVDDPRVYLAAERTFLAWVRTSVSLMGFGFVIARFALWIARIRLFGHADVTGPARGLDLARVWHGLCRCIRLRHGGCPPSRLRPCPGAGRRQPPAPRSRPH